MDFNSYVRPDFSIITEMYIYSEIHNTNKTDIKTPVKTGRKRRHSYG